MGTNLFGQQTINIRQLAKILRCGKSLLCHKSLTNEKIKGITFEFTNSDSKFWMKIIFFQTNVRMRNENLTK